MKLPVIGFVGMSHLGLNYAVATASKKFKVICYDENISTNTLEKIIFAKLPSLGGLNLQV